MKLLTSVLVLAALASSSTVFAQEVPVAPAPADPPAPTATPSSAPPPPPSPSAEERSEPHQAASPVRTPADAAPADADVAGSPAASNPPPASTGFQLALRGAFAQPFGKADSSSSVSDLWSSQGSFTVDIGGKLNPHWFLGAYVGLGIGGASGAFEQTCKQLDACATATFRIGAQVQYNFLPEDSINPWIGYGIGLESTAASASNNGRTASVAVVGPEYAHLMAGVDFRLNKTFGIGPFADFSLGQYSNMTVENVDGTKVDGSIASTAMHEWLQVGVRGVFFP